MFHVKPLLHKAFDTKELRAFCIKCFAVKVKLQQFVKQKLIKSSKTQKQTGKKPIKRNKKKEQNKYQFKA